MRRLATGSCLQPRSRYVGQHAATRWLAIELRRLQLQPPGTQKRSRAAMSASVTDRNYGWSGGEEARTKFGLLESQEYVVAGLPDTGCKVIAQCLHGAGLDLAAKN